MLAQAGLTFTRDLLLTDGVQDALRTTTKRKNGERCRHTLY